MYLNFCSFAAVLAVLAITPSLNAWSPEALLEETHKAYKSGKISNHVSSQCAGSIRQPNYGPFIQISYKPNDTLLPNEHCSWLVAVASTSTYHVILESPEFVPADNILTITSFRKSSVVPTTIAPTEFFTNITQANLLLLTLQTQQNERNRTGFTFYILPGTTVDNSVNASSAHVFLGTDQIISYPSTIGSHYGNNEMTTFLLPPGSGAGRQKIVTRYRGLEGCLDYLAIFNFQLASGSWNYSAKLCENNATSVVTGTHGILVIFDSDASIVSTGFDLAGVNADC